eukprot:Skav220627  [mRNA]  locus=scaffold112:194064:199522:+ [translate_table: standard]
MVGVSFLQDGTTPGPSDRCNPRIANEDRWDKTELGQRCRAFKVSFSYSAACLLARAPFVVFEVQHVMRLVAWAAILSCTALREESGRFDLEVACPGGELPVSNESRAMCREGYGYGATALRLDQSYFPRAPAKGSS